MFAPGSSLRALLEAPVRPGRVEWIGARPARRAPVAALEEAALDPEGGLAGDHTRHPKRQVTLIDVASLAAIASYLGRPSVDPAALRRNIVVSGINLHGLRDVHLRIGEAELLVTGECAPCSRMEEAFGTGGYNAVRGHGGVTARVVRAGMIRLGDPVEKAGSPPPAPAEANAPDLFRARAGAPPVSAAPQNGPHRAVQARRD